VKRIPLADLPLLRDAARLTAVTRIVLAAAVAGVALLAAALAMRLEPREAGFLPAGSDGLVVLDVSASISSDTFARIGATLDRLARTDGRFGLVLFSDVAYQALPLRTPARELRSFQRYFALREQRQPGLLPTPPESPWREAFSGGTRISTGLQLAYDLIRAEQPTRPAVLLVSDLDDDPGDLESLTSVALALKRERVPVRVVGLNPSPEDEAFIVRLLPRQGSDLTRATLPDEAAGRANGRLPGRLAAAALVLAFLLGANELFSARLRWRAG
jgi:hypothetical protein